MEKISLTRGVLHADTRPWRPWVNKASKGRTTATHKPYDRPSDEQLCKVSITHPVKLFWPRSQCFDHLYQEAELLLRNYPVQASICLYEDSHTEDEEEDEEELN
ncbi:hypothetical protein R3I94_009452 [Phoxinus phoxinus]